MTLRRLVSKAYRAGAANAWRAQPLLANERKEARRAVSLVELMVALAILGVGLLGAFRVFPVGLRASKRAELLSRATLIAERTLESTKLSAWEEIGNQPPITEDAFTVTVAVDQPEREGLSEPERLKQVTVTVEWPQEGRARAIAIGTYLLRPEP